MSCSLSPWLLRLSRPLSLHRDRRHCNCDAIVIPTNASVDGVWIYGVLWTVLSKAHPIRAREPASIDNGRQHEPGTWNSADDGAVAAIHVRLPQLTAAQAGVGGDRVL